MSIFDEIWKRNVNLTNAEPNNVHVVGVDDITFSSYNSDSQDWVKFAPPKIKPTIKNRRRASHFPTVYGILNNLIMKSISSMVITGDNQEAVDHILEMDKVWNIRKLLYEVLWKCLVDGELFYEKVIEDRHIYMRLLAFDGETNLIKKIYDDKANLIGYKQLVVRKSALKKWKNVSFWEDYQEQDVITVDFMVDDISNPILIEIDGVGQSLVKNVIDIAYEIESLTRMMPAIVHKSANVMVATVGNDTRKETKINNEDRNKIADGIADYHKKGVLLVPYGMSLEVVGDNVLPKIEEYIKSLKSLLYEGLVTPQSLYSSESSNRSTAEVQLTDNRTGHVLFIEFCQEFLKSWIERDLINPELVMNEYEEGDAYVSFMTDNPDLDTNYLEESSNETNDKEIKENGQTSTDD